MSQHKVPNSRRRFMQLGATAGGGLLFGFSLFGCSKDGDRKEAPPEKAVGQASTEHSDTPPGLARDAFIRIDRAGIVTLVIHKVEMGQGTFTSMPMLLAEELGADLSKVKLEQAPANNELYADPLLGGQVTGGSTSVRGAWKPLREAGAMVRSVLVQAAAKNWNVDTNELQVVAGSVRHQASGRSAHFGELVDAASKMELPKNVKLKTPDQYVLIGKSMRRLDSASKTNGEALFGIDARLPNMGIAAVAASPVTGGKLAGVDEAKAMAVKGVRQVLRLEGAVAVVADHFWAAKQGLAAAAPRWDDGANGNVSLAGIVGDMMKVSEGTGAVTKNAGDAVKALDQAGGRKIEAVYEMPFLAHATMEPMNCTVDLRADGCDLWVGTQVPALVQGAAAKVAGIPVEKVKVHNYYIGGGFGRRLEVDYVIQAVAFAKLTKGPVKFIWTREEDIQHDMFRPYYVDRLAARLDDKGRVAAWFHRVTGSSIMARFAPPAVKNGVDPDAVEGAADLQYTIPDMRVEYVRHEPAGVPTAFWRGVGPTHNVFVVESFIDELAQAAKQDPVAFRRALLDKSPRTLGVLNLAAQKAGWGKPLAPIAGRKVGRGVSTQFAFGSYMAQVAEVSVGPDGDVRVHRVVCAVDCGQAINPDTIVAQMEGGIVFGATAALWNEITLEKGRVQQTNFGDYRMMRINEAPRVEVHIVTSKDEPGGIGEPGTAGIAPALTNAVFAATGKRIRRLPIGEQLKT
ncbi:xanthine dehydrogenase family protein molybdopterin-binding subunit [Massilia sp. CFBP 13647]|uniref:xanthine dehydrogenase family protein molybdopterin-binding subunit n=2 Tax=unclassified Massilia TaxID=2609279 RepID=UPI00177EB066|nr:xanthine dehydrogenase family protein molybdopterin-binding subunit [Massilia sp. CFBP 13721]MBD8530877.1 xanthine dehydrogenase family protein molybdopterin-binding subunit [Massilia sp. CFBP 13647]MBD8674577.1 xanthine dehydrogenase family protein molybdopterin-binding subunit [Massilia sp. CFBP 13721]